MKKIVQIIFLTILFSLSISVQADSLKVYNLNFEYQAGKRIDHRQTVVEVGSYSKVVLNKNLNQFLLEYYFFEVAKSYSFAELKEFLKRAVAAKDGYSVAMTVKKACLIPDWSYLQAAEFLSLLGPDELQQIAQKDQREISYQLNKNTAVGKYFLFLTLEKYPDNFLNNCCAPPYDFVKLIAFYLEIQLKSGATPTDIINNLYQKKSLVLPEPTLVNIQKVLLLLVDMIDPAGQFLSSYQRLAEVYPKYFTALQGFLAQLRETTTTRLIEESRVQQAFDLILLEDIDHRTEKTHQLITQLIPKVTDGYAPVLVIDPYRSYLHKVADKDSEIKKLLIEQLEVIIKKQLENGKIFEAKDFYSELFGYRPNPNHENSALLFEQIKAFDQKNLRDQVYLIRANYQLTFSLGQKFWFLKNGYYFSLKILWLSLLAIVIIGILIYLQVIKVERYRRMAKEFLRKYIYDRFSAKSTAQSAFNQQFEQLNKDRQRYRSLLKYFELDETSSLEQIKSTYRKRIKAYHPDLNPNQNEEDKSKFLQISERYDDLVALYTRFSAK